jgi:ATP-dependent RNA helicase SUPV3L1/SUV3
MPVTPHADASASGTEKVAADSPALEQVLQPSTIGNELAEVDRFGIETTPLAASTVQEASQVPILGGEHLGSPNQIAASQSSDTATTQEAAPELIEIWRPVRRGAHQRGPRRERSSRRRPTAEAKEMQASGPAANEMPAIEGGSKPSETPGTPLPSNEGLDSPKPRRRGHRRRHPAPSESLDGAPKERSLRVVRRGRDQAAEPSDRSTHSVSAERQRREPRGDRPDRDPVLRAKYIKGKGAGAASRDREADPDSPFAKLAKLKEQLEANAKNPR